MSEFIFITPDDKRWYNLKDLPNEKWKDIKDYEGLYEISNYSRIKSLERVNSRGIILKEKILKPYKDRVSRYSIKLYKHGCKKGYFVHRLVGKEFIPNPYNKPEINHIEPVTKEICDNRICNLQWCTSKENSLWTIKCGNMYQPCLGKFGKDHHLSKPIIQLDLNNKFIKKWDNAREINRELGIDYRFVSRCCKHRCKTAHGFIFIFEEEYNDKMGNIKK